MSEQQNQAAGRQVVLQKMYLKDASVEVPKAPEIFTRQWQPETDVQVNTQATDLGENNWQVLLSVTVTAKAGADVAFLVEVHQAGIFTIVGFDPVELGAVLGGYSPGLLFPFAREAVADLVQRAGFPQLLLQPINFDALYLEHQRANVAKAPAQPADESGIILPQPSTEAAIAVLGAGSFGTALAIHLARRGSPTLLWGRDAAKLQAMQEARVNAQYLPDCAFPAKLTALSDLRRAVGSAEDLLISTPSHTLRETLTTLKPFLRQGQGVACACKGLEPQSGKLVHEVIEDVLGSAHPLAVISGPTFAKELGIGLPTAVTVASTDVAFAEKIADRLHGDGFRAYTAVDLPGVEIGGAAKNVMAICVGLADGLNLGANTRAAIITRGLAEIMRLGEALGAKPETLMGLSGMGDLVLTCTDNQSRNRRMGLLLAQGKTVPEAIAEIRQVVEGVKAAPEVLRLARKLGVDMPITDAVTRVISGEITPVEAVRVLAMRPKKAESE